MIESTSISIDLKILKQYLKWKILLGKIHGNEQLWVNLDMGQNDPIIPIKSTKITPISFNHKIIAQTSIEMHAVEMSITDLWVALCSTFILEFEFEYYYQRIALNLFQFWRWTNCVWPFDSVVNTRVELAAVQTIEYKSIRYN